MPRTIKVAAVQMDANPASVSDRLNRADLLITQAAQAGAQLVVLPELFNTGYSYSEGNYRLAEPIDGITSDWMRKSAAHLGIHLTGSMMLFDQDEIFNALLLFSPKGQIWRYDKNYPWAWERGYFRERRGTTVAHTELGDLGLMICWDIGHRHLWKAYAGQVDMMVIASCPPDGTNPTYLFPDGRQITLDDLGPLIGSIKDSGRKIFGDMLNQQTAWLGVPTVHTVGSGHIQTRIPRGTALAWSLILFAPRVVRMLPHASKMQMSCDMIPGCKVVNASGQVISERAQAEGEGYTLANITIPDTRPMPEDKQPASTLNWMAYFNADILIPLLMQRVYREGLRRLQNSTEGPA
jgi:hypothetical protein